MTRVGRALFAIFALIYFSGSRTSGQQQAAVDLPGGPIAVYSTDFAGLREWDARITGGSRMGTLRRRSAVSDPMVLNRTVERFDQFHDGVRIWGADVVRDSERGVPISVFGVLSPELSLAVEPGLLPVAAAAAMVRLGGDEARLLREPELVILPLVGGDHRLAYTAPVYSADDVFRVFVDAHTGAELLRYTEIQSQSAAIGTGTGVLGDTKKLSVEASGGSFIAFDRHRPPVIRTFDLRGNLARFKLLDAGRLPYSTSDLAVDSDNAWTDRAVVDAHAHVSWTYDYYFKRFGRSGLDGRDGPINITVNSLTQQGALSAAAADMSYAVNASWCGVCGPGGQGRIFFGSGIPAGVFLSSTGNNYTFFSGALDIAAHELTHGVLDATSDLIYYQESGALNEAFADMMGKSVEFFYRAAGSGPGQADYTMGKDISRAVRSGSLNGDRSMSNPALYGDPDHYSRRYTGTADNAGVHVNSGIANHAFYLAIEGGTHRLSGQTVAGVGPGNRLEIERAFYRAFTTLMPANSTFLIARAATTQAARDLYGSGSRAEQAIIQAWTAVGVPDPATVTTVSGSLSAGRSTTWTYTVPTTGRLEINLLWSNPGATDLDVYLTREGCSPAFASCILAASEGPVTSESISWPARSGERYWITIVNFSGPASSYSMQSWIAAGF